MPRKARSTPVTDESEVTLPPTPKKPAKGLTFPLRVTNGQGVEFVVSEKYYNAHKSSLTVAE